MGRHSQNYEYRVHANSSATKVARLVGSGQRVLELGCGPGMITRLLAGQNCSVTAIECDENAVKAVAPYCEAVHTQDLDESTWSACLSPLQKFDAVVAGDVFEHLADPWRTMAQLKPLLDHGGCIVLSLPHAGHNALVACLIASDFEYKPWGLLDKTHLRFFGIHNMQSLCEEAGFKIVAVDYVIKVPEQTEFARRWRQLPKQLRDILAKNPFGSVYQVIVKVVPTSGQGRALKLRECAPVALPDHAALPVQLKHYLLSFVSLRVRQRVAEVLSSLGLRL